MNRSFRLLMTVITVVVLAASVALVGSVRADGGSPFSPGDDRINPLTGDRLAIHCNDSNLDVWGVDTNKNGQLLTSFNFAELTSGKTVVHSTAQGTVTLYLDALPKTHVGYSYFEAKLPTLITDVGTKYHITWMGGPWGADGSQPFVKTFSCTYLPIAGH